MNAPERPRHKLLIGKRISTIKAANADAKGEDPETLLILFTDGTVATIDALALFGGNAMLEVKVDGY